MDWWWEHSEYSAGDEFKLINSDTVIHLTDNHHQDQDGVFIYLLIFSNDKALAHQHLPIRQLQTDICSPCGSIVPQTFKYKYIFQKILLVLSVLISLSLPRKVAEEALSVSSLSASHSPCTGERHKGSYIFISCLFGPVGVSASLRFINLFWVVIFSLLKATEARLEEQKNLKLFCGVLFQFSINFCHLILVRDRKSHCIYISFVIPNLLEPCLW